MSTLKERLAARREDLQHERDVVLPIPGYEDMLAGRYRVLSYRELRRIGKRNQGLEGTEDGELILAADTLIEACSELLEVKDDGAYASTGQRWNANGVRELFGADLPEGATARDAIFHVFPPTQTELMLHFNDYDEHLKQVVSEVDDKLVGESEARSEPEVQSISQ